MRFHTNLRPHMRHLKKHAVSVGISPKQGSFGGDSLTPLQCSHSIPIEAGGGVITAAIEEAAGKAASV